jgi:hypothetical protein
MSKDENPVISATVQNYWEQENADREDSTYEDARSAFMEGESEAQSEARRDSLSEYERLEREGNKPKALHDKTTRMSMRTQMWVAGSQRKILL